MKASTFILIVTLSGVGLFGCSKHPSLVSMPSVTYTNLGVVEFSDGIPIRHALGDGRVYVLTPAIGQDGIVHTRLDLEVTNASGAVETLLGPTAGEFPGNLVKFSVADVGVEMIPQIKAGND